MKTYSRKRDRPLRTYGKKATSGPGLRGDTPPTRRRRLDDGKQTAESETRITEKHDTESKPESAELATETAQRASILNYFRPTPPGLSSARSNQVGQACASQSLPSVGPKARRRPRALRLRTASVLDEPLPAEAVPDGDDRKASERGGGDRVENRGDGVQYEVTLEPLRDRGGSPPNKRHAGPHNGKPRAPSRPVQTTLNISAQAPFSECKVCDTVWNPLCPDDVVYHKKRHSTVLRSRKKMTDEPLKYPLAIYPTQTHLG